MDGVKEEWNVKLYLQSNPQLRAGQHLKRISLHAPLKPTSPHGCHQFPCSKYPSKQFVPHATETLRNSVNASTHSAHNFALKKSKTRTELDELT